MILDIIERFLYKLYTLCKGQKHMDMGDVYRHFKGSLYTTICMVTHTETEEEMVAYFKQGSPEKVWVRPVDSFSSTVELGGQTVKRFAVYPSEDSRLQIEAGEYANKNPKN